MSRKIYIERLKLKEFRNYSNLDISFSNKINVIIGKNGIGKTNIVEAISLHLPGRGLRGEKIINFDNFNQDQKYKVFWHINSIIHTKLGEREFELSRSGDFDSSKSERIIKVDGKLVKNKKILAELSSIIWLTPRMDQIFIASSSERRKFFDKIAINYNSQHNENLARYEDLMRERIKILEDNYSDEIWLGSIEKTMAELATSIFFTREDAIGYINSSMSHLNSNFIRASLSVEGDFENLMRGKNALEAEDHYVSSLKANRRQDKIEGRTSITPLKSDLNVVYIAKNIPANMCSTGEQKLLLISIILAEIYSRSHWFNIKPIVILDDITSHLDKDFRNALLEEIRNLDCQTFITATNLEDFQIINDEVFYIKL